MAERGECYDAGMTRMALYVPSHAAPMAKLAAAGLKAAHGALPHRAPLTRCAADLVHRVWHRRASSRWRRPPATALAP